MRRWHAWVAVAVAVVALLVNVAAATAYFYDSARADVVADGVTIGGVHVGGLSATSARERLRQTVVPRLTRPVTLTYRGHRFPVDPSRRGLGVDVDAMVDAAIGLSRQGGLLHRVVRDVRGTKLDENVPIRASASRDLVERYVDWLAGQIDQPARSARVVPSASRLQIVKADSGLAVRRDLLVRELERRLVDADASRVLVVPTRTLRPHMTTGDLRRRYAAFITVDRNGFRLILWRHLKRYKTYTIAVGQIGLETPAGLYHINDKQVNPWWHVPLSAWAGDLAGRVIPPGPSNPIQARWMGFYGGAGIHGTTNIASLGSAASHGCIRMAIPDVEELYNLVPLGTPIYVG